MLGIAQGAVAFNGGVAVNANGTSPIQIREVESNDNAPIAMDEGVAQGGHDNNNAAANGANSIAVGDTHDSPIANNGSKAIGSVNDDAAVGMDNANVVSHPDDSAIAQGAGGVALNDTDHFAVSTGNNSPAIQDANDVAFVGAGASAQDFSDSAVAQQAAWPSITPTARHRRERQAAHSTSSGAIVQNGGNAIGTVSTGAASIVSGAGSNGQSGYISSGAQNQGPAMLAIISNGAQNQGSGQANYQTGANAVNNNGTGNVGVGSVTNSPINVGAGNSALQNTPANANLNQGSGSAQQQNGAATSLHGNGANSSANSGSISSGNTVAGDTNTPIVTGIAPGPECLQTVALTTLKQVNTGTSIGNGNSLYGSGATINANSQPIRPPTACWPPPPASASRPTVRPRTWST